MSFYAPGNYLRYTINSRDTILPVGIEIDGDAPVVYYKALLNGFTGEGGIQFKKAMKYYISASLMLSHGEKMSDLETVTCWFSKKNSDGTYAKIPASIESMKMPKSGASPIKFAGIQFEYDAAENDVLWLFASTTSDDGAYLISTALSQHMVEISVETQAY